MTKTTKIDRGQLLRDWMEGKRDDLRIGLTEAESKRFSLLKLIRSQVDPTRANQENAAFEIEACRTAQVVAGDPKHGGYRLPAEVTGIGYQKAANMTEPSEGGFLQDNTMHNDGVDLLRPHSALFRVAETIHGLTPGDHEFPRIDSGAAGSWLDEDEEATDTGQKVGLLRFRPRTVAASTYLTRPMVKSTVPGMDAVIKRDIGKGVAQTAEEGLLTGIGGRVKPIGLLNWAGIGAVVGGTNGAQPTWDHITGLEGELGENNADTGRLAYLTNAAMRRRLKRTPQHDTASVGGWIWQPYPGNPDSSVGLVNGYPAYVSNLVPSDLTKGSANNCSAIIFGDWSQYLIGLWGGLELVANPYTYSKRGGVEITAFLDLDALVLHSESFAIMADALP